MKRNPHDVIVPSSPEKLSARAWVGVVSRAHVLRGVAGGFAQLCHGKRAALARMRPGDALVYYSPTTEYGGGVPLRAFTALGRVVGDDVYPFDMGGGFVPFRRDIAYERAGEVRLGALAPRLAFVRDNPAWGMLARRGHFEIGLDDLAVIREAMRAAALTPAGGGGTKEVHDRHDRHPRRHR
jgi:hypothetical protein